MIRTVAAISLTVVLASVSHAQALAAEASAPKPGSAPGTVFYAGYSHVDFNWLWDWPDTAHTWDSTARTALNLMYRFPNYHFSQSQAAAYRSIESLRPDVFQDIKARVAEGRWHLVGGMWSESDTNIPSGEGLARCFLLGQTYFKEKFGKQAVVGWLPDDFGHTRQLPQILKQAEMDYFCFQRCPPGKYLFWWQAPDGSRVLAYNSPGWYNDHPSTDQAGWPATLNSQVGVDNAMVIFGVGNHGGGPSISDLEVLETLETSPTFPKVVQSGPEAFFQDCLAKRTDYPIVNNELQYIFEGCYTSIGLIKRILRDSENELFVAESLASLSSIFGGDYPTDDLRTSWRHSAFNQFHDIACGSAIASPYEEAANKQKMVKQMTERAIGNAWANLERRINTSGVGTPIAVYNPVAWTRTDVVEATVPFDANPAFVRVSTPSGAEVLSQITGRETRDGKTFVTVVFVAANMPSMGYRVYRVEASETETEVADPLTVADGVVTSPTLIAKVDAANGQLSRLYDRSANRELLPTGQRAMRLQLLGENDGDGWTIRLNGASTYLDTPTSFRVLETGPVRARFEVVYKNGASTYTQEILAYRGVNRVDARLFVDFQDLNLFLKTVIPVNLNNPTATFEVPYGTVARARDGHEVPLQKFMDLSQGTTYGLSVLNDCKYGADVNGTTMRLSLLRGTHSPSTVGDRGFHRIGYSLYPHAGDWKSGASIRRANDFNLPLRVMPCTSHEGVWAAEQSFIGSAPGNAVVTALKKAEDGDGYVLRWYETFGSTLSGGYTLPVPVASAIPVNILEHTQDGTIAPSGTYVPITTKPYGIQSMRVRFQ